MRVLIAEDNKNVASTLAAMIGVSNHHVVEMVGSGLEAIYAYDRHKPDVVVMDYLMDGLNGITACRNIVSKDPNARVIIVSAALNTNDTNAFCAGAYAVLRKPIEIEQLQYVFDTITPPPVQIVEEPKSTAVEPSEFF